MAKRRKFTDQFKAKVALEALRGDKTSCQASVQRFVAGGSGAAKPVVAVQKEDENILTPLPPDLASGKNATMPISFPQQGE